MIFSQNLIFSDQQAITATAASTNVIDLGAKLTPPHEGAALSPDIGIGSKTCLLIQVTEAFDNLTSLNIACQKDDNSAFSSPETIWDEDIVLAGLTVGARALWEHISKRTDQQYLRLLYTVTGTGPTVGKIMAGITMGNQNDYG